MLEKRQECRFYDAASQWKRQSCRFCDAGITVEAAILPLLRAGYALLQALLEKRQECRFYDAGITVEAAILPLLRTGYALLHALAGKATSVSLLRNTDLR